MTITMRLEEPAVISVSSQVLMTQTIDAKVTLLLDNCSIQGKLEQKSMVHHRKYPLFDI